MQIEQLSPLIVAERLKVEPTGVYLDVRTEQEFSRGHPAGALNIPIAVLAPGSFLPWPNLEFIRVVRANIDRGASRFDQRTEQPQLLFALSTAPPGKIPQIQPWRDHRMFEAFLY